MDNPQKITSLFGNPDQIFSPGIYNNIIKSDAGPVQNLIRIETGIGNSTIQGLLITPFKIGIEAVWDNAGILETITSNGLLGTLNDYMQLFFGAAGLADPTNLGLSSQKIYKNSGYLEFDVSFRVIDWQGTGDPITSAFVLSSMCLPTKVDGWTLAQTVKNVITDIGLNTADKVISWVYKTFPATPGTAQETTSTLNNSVNAATDFAIKYIGKAKEGLTKMAPQVNAAMDYSSDPQFFVLASSPLPVKVKIGSYFSRSDIITKSVHTTFSKECTYAGPLYADFDVSFSSRRAMLLKDTNNTLGLLNVSPARVSRQDIKNKYEGYKVRDAANQSPIRIS